MNMHDTLLWWRTVLGPIKTVPAVPLSSHRIPMELMSSPFPWPKPQFRAWRVVLPIIPPWLSSEILCHLLVDLPSPLAKIREKEENPLKSLGNSTLTNHPPWGIPHLISHIQIPCVFDSHLAGAETWDVQVRDLCRLPPPSRETVEPPAWPWTREAGNGKGVAGARKEGCGRGETGTVEVCVWEILEDHWSVREWGSRRKRLRNVSMG